MWTFLFLMIATHGLLLSLLFLTKSKGRYLPNSILSALLLTHSIIIGLCVVFWNDWQTVNIHFNYTLAALPLLVGPLMWLYFKTLLDHPLDRRIWLHFIPFLAVVGYFLPFYLEGTEGKVAFFEAGQHLSTLSIVMSKIINGTHLASLTVYSGVLFFLLKRREEDTSESGNLDGNSKLPPKMMTAESHWLWHLALLFGIYTLTYYLYFGFITLLNFPLCVDFVISLAGAAAIYTIGWMGFNRPTLFQQKEAEAKIAPTKKYQASRLTSSQLANLAQRLIIHTEETHAYLDENLKLKTLSQQTNIPTHHLSEVLNQYLKKSYADFINEYRVEAVKKMMFAKQYEHLTMEAIGFEAGFNSRATFYKSFKKMTGLSPTQYKKREMGAEG